MSYDLRLRRPERGALSSDADFEGQVESMTDRELRPSDTPGRELDAESALNLAKNLTQGMTSGGLGLIEGVRGLHDLCHALFAHGSHDAEFKIVMDLEARTRHLPIGDERRLWAASALAEKDLEIAEVERAARDMVIDSMTTVIGRLEARIAAGRRRGWRAWWSTS